MKLSRKVRILNALGLFNLARDIAYRCSPEKHEQLRFYKNFVSEGDLIFDVGANIGQKTDIFLKLGARVVAVEPQPKCAGYLKRKYLFNHRVTVEQTALDAEPGEKVMHINEANALSSMSDDWIEKTRDNQRFQGLEWKKMERVRTTTLSHLLDKHGTPKFCKIDVEGFELNVIRGLDRPIPNISLECTPENLENLIKVIEHLNGLGALEAQFCSWDHYQLSEVWLNAEEIIRYLTSRNPESLTGDLYARYTD